jgi:IS5 family transposase
MSDLRIGHMKQDGKLERNFLRGCLEDKINAILRGVGNNIRLILRRLEMRFA